MKSHRVELNGHDVLQNNFFQGIFDSEFILTPEPLDRFLGQLKQLAFAVLDPNQTNLQVC